MAVKAKADITLSHMIDVVGHYRYYLLQSSTAAVPERPTTFPPANGGGDTITWDGNTEGRELVPLEANVYFCHVSDAVPTLEDIAGGISGTLYYNQDGVEGEAQIPISSFQLADGCIMLTDGGDGTIGVVVSESVVGTDLEGLVFNRAGLYLLIVNMPTLVTYTSSLTINGYTGFGGGAWDDTEPSYTSGSTNSLYFVDCSVYSNGTFYYSPVSLSTAYEAAKTAYNEAIAAGQAAADAKDTADNTASDLSENYYTKTDMDSSLELVDGTIMGKVEATYVSSDSLKNAKDALNKAINDAESDLSARLDVAKNDLADTSDKFAEFKRTVEGMLTFDLDANGVPTLAIQAIVDGIAAAYAMKIHNSGYSVEYEGAKVGYMEKHNFAIPFAKVKEVQFAEQGSDGALGTASAVWVRRSNGHLTLKNLGG